MKEIEYWDGYDCSGNPTGDTLVRGESIPKGRYHMVCCVTVRHEDGSFLLLKRSPHKQSWPNIWEIGAGGAALAGESALQCARRELYEETGICCDSLEYLGRYWEGPRFYEGFLCTTGSKSVRLQEGENTDFRWLTVDEFLEFFDSKACIPKFKRRLGGYVNSIREGSP